MMQTDEHEAEVLRAEADEIQRRRRDAIFDAYREQSVTAAINALFDAYPNLTQDVARALAWGWLEHCVARKEWESVQLVITAYRARYPRDGAA